MSDDERTAETADIGQLLRTYRGRTPLTQEELAAAAGVTGGLIGNVERGARNLGPETVQRVADALHLTTEERAALVAARKRYADAASKTKGGPPPWEQLLAGQRELSDRLEQIAALLERDD